ncbi:MAG: lysylphosphatidylglycerol synthase domain-containing protein [Acidimicrobiales bacterium]
MTLPARTQRGGPSRHRSRLPRLARAATSVALTIVLVTVVIPKVTGSHWRTILTAIGAVSGVQLLVLGAVWIAGLVAHSTTLAAAMPRLGRRRALMLSLTGSSVSNLFPFGGAIGMALNYRMSRSWGFEPRSIGTYTVITNIWDVLARLSLPAIALAWLVLAGAAGASRLIGTAALATAALVVFAAATTLFLASETAAVQMARILDRAVNGAAALAHRPVRFDVGGALVRMRAESADLVRSAWPRLTIGVASYAALLAVLLWASLDVAGAKLTVPVVLAGLAFERVVTMVPLTPGGAGVVEVGLSGLLIALGGDPVATVAGVLLYRFFTYAVEIPVGGLGALTWLWTNRSRQLAPAGVTIHPPPPV